MTQNEETTEATSEEEAVEVLVEELESSVYIAESDITLHCQPVQGGVLQTLLAELSIMGDNIMDNPEQLSGLSGSEQLQAIRSSEKLFSYCAGWGVEEDPPGEIPEVLDLMGVDVSKTNTYRAAWVRHALGATQAELGKLVGMVIALTFSKKSPNGQ